MAPDCSDLDIEAHTLTAILAPHDTLLGRIKLCFGADRTTFERELMPLVQGYARFVHLLPASVDSHFRGPGGLLQLGLETAFFSLQGTDAHIFSGRSTLVERLELEQRWRMATFIGGLCCGLHRALSHCAVTTAQGAEWPALLGGLAPWLAQQGAARYRVRWRIPAQECRGLGLLALPHVVPADLLQTMSQGNGAIVSQLLACLGGAPHHREHPVLEQLVRRSMCLVIDRNLRATGRHDNHPPHGSHLEHCVVDAMRRLAALHPGWTPNGDKSRVWLGPEGLFLVWPGAAQDMLALLESEQLAGIPKSPQVLLKLLVEAGVFAMADEACGTWSIQPPGAKSRIDAVKLSHPAVLGLDPLPAALATPVVAPADGHPDSPSPGPPASAAHAVVPTAAVVNSCPTAKAPEAVATSSAPVQMSLLASAAMDNETDAPAATREGPKALAADGTPRPHGIGSPAGHTVSVKVPMRLTPTVHSALLEIVAVFNGADGSTDICMVPEGLFVPLREFERRGVPPSQAIRALEDARMLWRPRPSGPPTVSHPSRAAMLLGVVLSRNHVDGPPATTHEAGTAAAPLKPHLALRT